LPCKFFSDADYEDIFQIRHKEFTIAPKGRRLLSVSFVPKNPLQYEASAYFESESGNSIMRIYGECIEPEVKIDIESTDFGIVGLNCSEFRVFNLHNPTSIDICLRLTSSNNIFPCIPVELIVPAKSSREGKIKFHPKEKNVEESTILKLEMLDYDPTDVSGLDVFDEEVQYSRRKVLRKTHEIKWTGKGGIFGMVADGMEVKPPTPSESGNSAGFMNRIGDSGSTILTTTPPTAALTNKSEADLRHIASQAQVDKNELDEEEPEEKVIEIAVPRLGLAARVKKSFPVENTGDSRIKLIVTSKFGAELQATSESDKRVFSYSIDPPSIFLEPHSKAIITFAAEGLCAGTDSVEIYIRTDRLVKNIRFKVCATINVINEADASVKAFARSDLGFDELLSFSDQEMLYCAGDQNLWKLLLPVVRISYKLPSQEHSRVPFIEVD
jgi:hypothetical protein